MNIGCWASREADTRIMQQRQVLISKLTGAPRPALADTPTASPHSLRFILPLLPLLTLRLAHVSISLVAFLTRSVLTGDLDLAR